LTACHKGVQHTYIYTYVIITYHVNIDSLPQVGAAILTACHKGVQHTYIYTYVIIAYHVNIDSLTKGGAAI